MGVYPKTKGGRKLWRFDRKIHGCRLTGQLIWGSAKDAMTEEALAVHEFLTTGFSPFLPLGHPQYRQKTPTGSGLASPYITILSLVDARLDFLKTHRAWRTYRDAKSLLGIGLSCRPDWSSKNPAEISFTEVQRFQDDLIGLYKRKKKTLFMVNRIMHAMRETWNHPWETRKRRRTYPENPFAEVDDMRIDRKEIIVPTQDEVAKVITSSQDGEFRLYLKVMEETGGRPEEVRRLRPTDIKNPPTNNFMAQLWTRKTRHGQLTPRFVPITKGLHDEMTTWANGRTYLFEQRGNKKPRDQTWALKLQRKACGSAGVKYFSPHKYRHYRASLWLQEGINPVTIQEWLGHTSFATTTLYLRRLGGPWWRNQVQER